MSCDINLNSYNAVKNILLRAYNSEIKIDKKKVMTINIDDIVKPRSWSPNDTDMFSFSMPKMIWAKDHFLTDEGLVYCVKYPNNYEDELLNDKDLSDEFKAWLLLNNFEFLRRK